MPDKTTINNENETDINERFDKLENSKIGKLIPKKIPELSSAEIAKILILLKAFFMAAYYLIIKSLIPTGSENFFTKLINSLKYVSTFIIFIDISIAGILYFFDYTILVIVLLITFCVKLMTFIICSFLYYFKEFNIICYFFYLLFICSFVAVDLAFGYYIIYRLKNCKEEYINSDIKKNESNKE